MLTKSKLSERISKSLKARRLAYSMVKKDQKGIALVEFAIAAPVLAILLMGTVDLAVFLAAHQRISRSAYTMSNLMTQMDEGLSESQVSDMMLALDQVSRPFNISDHGVATVTAIIGEGTDGAAPDNYEIAWKRCYGANASDTKFGATGTTVPDGVIPGNMIVTTAQIVVVTEVSYEFEPILGFLPLDGPIEYESYFRPRRGTIENIVNDGSAPSACNS